MAANDLDATPFQLISKMRRALRGLPAGPWLSEELGGDRVTLYVKDGLYGTRVVIAENLDRDLAELLQLAEALGRQDTDSHAFM